MKFDVSSDVINKLKMYKEGDHNLIEEYNELFEKYAKLGINEKRNALSEEVVKITYLLRTLLNKYEQDIIDEPYNYSKIKDGSLTESKFLDLEYKDLYNIKTELMLLIGMLEGK